MQENKNDKGEKDAGSVARKIGALLLRIEGPVVYGNFLSRPNRFLAQCEVKNHEISAYIPNPGPMPDLLFPGVEVLLRYAPNSHRKTEYDLVCVRHRGTLLSVDVRVPNQLLAEVLPTRTLVPFTQYETVQPEARYEGSRFDFLLQANGHPSCYIEAKSSTHAEEYVGYFPRAVTERGQRHLQELMHALDHGYRAVIVFIVQRPDVVSLRPNDRIDPAFGQKIRQAAQYGVEVHAWRTRLDEQSYQITIDQAISVDLSPASFL